MKLLSRRNLVQFLIAKSIVEALFATSIAAGAYLVTTNPRLSGWLDAADGQTIAGWAVDGRNPQSRVDVQLFIDDRFIENRISADLRPDVHAAHRADDDWHGFAFKTPNLSPGEHEVRVYAVNQGRLAERRTLQMIGKPLRFQVSATQGKLNP